MCRCERGRCRAEKCSCKAANKSCDGCWCIMCENRNPSKQQEQQKTPTKSLKELTPTKTAEKEHKAIKTPDKSVEKQRIELARQTPKPPVHQQKKSQVCQCCNCVDCCKGGHKCPCFQRGDCCKSKTCKNREFSWQELDIPLTIVVKEQ